MSALSKLADRCEAATGPDGGLDFDILCAVDPRARTSGPVWSDPAFTKSLDAAMTLVPEGCYISALHQGPSGGNWAGVTTRSSEPYRTRDGKAASLALALCAAALRAQTADA